MDGDAMRFEPRNTLPLSNESSSPSWPSLAWPGLNFYLEARSNGTAGTRGILYGVKGERANKPARYIPSPCSFVRSFVRSSRPKYFIPVNIIIDNIYFDSIVVAIVKVNIEM